MVKLFKVLGWVAAIAVVSYALYYFFPAPCTSPITYRIGTFDTRFGITEKDFLVSVKKASDLWSASVGKELFTYDPKGKLTINLIYDERQKTTQQNQELQADIKKTAELASSIKHEYETLEADLAVRKNDYEAELRQFEAQQNAYEADVTYWNSRGGAPENEYQVLKRKENELKASAQILEQKRLSLNAKVDQVNAFIQKYNLLVRDANEDINTINQRAGKEFQEGTYDPNTDTINIYEFSTTYKLLRILAHELGHALTLDHNENPASIMYELNQANTLSLSLEDKEALKTLCNIP
jgi:hypothetical protein